MQRVKNLWWARRSVSKWHARGLYVTQPYSLCSHLNLLTIFPPRVDAQRVQMRSEFSINTFQRNISIYQDQYIYIYIYGVYSYRPINIWDATPFTISPCWPSLVHYILTDLYFYYYLYYYYFLRVCFCRFCLVFHVYALSSELYKFNSDLFLSRRPLPYRIGSRVYYWILYSFKKILNPSRPSEHPPVRGEKCQNV